VGLVGGEGGGADEVWEFWVCGCNRREGCLLLILICCSLLALEGSSAAATAAGDPSHMLAMMFSPLYTGFMVAQLSWSHSGPGCEHGSCAIMQADGQGVEGLSFMWLGPPFPT